MFTLDIYSMFFGCACVVMYRWSKIVMVNNAGDWLPDHVVEDRNDQPCPCPGVKSIACRRRVALKSLLGSLIGTVKAPFWTGGGMMWKWTLELKLPLHLQSLGLDFLPNPHSRPQPLCCAPDRSTPSHWHGQPVLSQVLGSIFWIVWQLLFWFVFSLFRFVIVSVCCFSSWLKGRGVRVLFEMCKLY